MSKALPIPAKTVDKVLDFLRGAPVHVIENLGSSIKELAETTRVIDAGRTERARITSDASIEKHRMDTQLAAIEGFLQHTFTERKGVFDKQFLALDKAIESGQKDVAIALLGAVVENVKTSPLSNAAEFSRMLAGSEPLKLE